MLLLGHRGSRSSRSVPENTFAAFDLALEHGCDGFEFDVRLTRDGVPVVCHDATFRGLSVSRNAASRFQELPTLEVVLDRYRSRAFLDIELKVFGMEAQVLRVISVHFPKRGFVVSSFLPRVLLEIKRLDSTVPVGLICENSRQLRRWKQLPIEIVIAHQSLVTRGLVSAVHDDAQKLWVWTVNRRSSMSRVDKLGVDAVISDRTDALTQTLGR